MDRFARAFVSVLLLATAGLASGCGSGTGLLTGSTSAAADAPATLNNDDPAARPIAVAWTSARAQRCGFYFDPAKLRTSYLAYESRQPSGDIAKAEKTYDSTFPKPKVAESCGLFGCGGGSSDDKWDTKKFWDDQATRTGR
jgi:hypothetical protein